MTGITVQLSPFKFHVMGNSGSTAKRSGQVESVSLTDPITVTREVQMDMSMND